MNEVVLPYPKKFCSLLNVFRCCFSRPQFKNFCNIAGGIVLSSKSTVSRFSKIFVERDASSLNKFLTRSPWDENNVKDRFHEFLFRSVPDLDVFIGDDTLSEKPFAKVMQGVDSHYSGLKKSHCNGHSIVTTGFYTDEGCVPFDAQIYLRKGRAEKLGREFQTKNQIMMNLLDSASSKHDFEYFVFDSWYSNNLILNKVKSLGKTFVTQIKSNRNVTIKRKKREIRNHCKDISLTQYEYRIINNNLFRYYETDGFISKIGTVRILLCQMLTEKKNNIQGWSKINYIITNDMTSPNESIIKTYTKRNSIEFFHREGKQQLGMDKYQTQNLRGIERHLFLVILVYTLLMLLNLLLIKKEGLKGKTIGELKEYLKEDCYTNLLKKAKIQNLDTKKRIAKNLAYAI